MFPRYPAPSILQGGGPNEADGIWRGLHWQPETGHAPTSAPRIYWNRCLLIGSSSECQAYRILGNLAKLDEVGKQLRTPLGIELLQYSCTLDQTAVLEYSAHMLNCITKEPVHAAMPPLYREVVGDWSLFTHLFPKHWRMSGW